MEKPKQQATYYMLYMILSIQKMPVPELLVHTPQERGLLLAALGNNSPSGSQQQLALEAADTLALFQQRGQITLHH